MSKLELGESEVLKNLLEEKELLEKQNKILKEALEFYADKENWFELCVDGGVSGTNIVNGDFVPCLIENVKYGYESARQALKKCEEMQ